MKPSENKLEEKITERAELKVGEVYSVPCSFSLYQAVYLGAEKGEKGRIYHTFASQPMYTNIIEKIFIDATIIDEITHDNRIEIRTHQASQHTHADWYYQDAEALSTCAGRNTTRALKDPEIKRRIEEFPSLLQKLQNAGIAIVRRNKYDSQ